MATGFKGHLINGTLKRATSSTVNTYGDPVLGTPQTFRVQGFHDNYDAKYRAQAGIAETDSKITLILGNGTSDPKKDDIITLEGYKSFKVRSVKFDPAMASAECQVFEVR